MSVVKYRMQNPKLAPRRTRLAMPGWAGESQPRATGSHEQPWHCIPFTEAATGGIELFYPHDEALHVTATADGPAFDGVGDGDRAPDWEAPPFRDFGRAYYTYQLLLDLKVEPGFALRAEPHPRFYTDTTGTVPIAVPALIRHWWPMVYFVVFKTPLPGQTHIFRPGEPFIQFTVVEADTKLDLIPMPAEEAAERELQAERIYASRSVLSSDTQWTSSSDTVFDGTYRRIFGAAKSAKR